MSEMKARPGTLGDKFFWKSYGCSVLAASWAAALLLHFGGESTVQVAKFLVGGVAIGFPVGYGAAVKRFSEQVYTVKSEAQTNDPALGPPN